MDANIRELVLACIVALIAILFTIFAPNPEIRPGFAILFLIGPLGAIAFSERLGQYTGPTRGGYITTQTPGCVVKLIGWLLLLLVAVVIAVRCLQVG